MASIIDRGNGRRAIQFEGMDGGRKTFGLGKCSKRDATSIRDHIEAILASKLSGRSVPSETAEWIGKLPKTSADKLTEFGLIESRDRAESMAQALAAFVGGYIDKREADTKPATRTVYLRTKKHLVSYFGADKALADITTADAKDFRRYLIGLKKKPDTPTGPETSKLADNTIRRTCGIARQFFADAVERKLIAANPFVSKAISVAVSGNAERFHFVTLEDAQKVLDACPDAQTRLVFALARFGGLRTPSETLALRWSDIDWTAKRMTVHAPKTEHHEGKATRLVPIFPELLPYLQDAHDPEGDKVITIGTDGTKNFRTRFTRFVERAGLKPWPKLFQNLRATRQTELEDRFPTHVVCGWMGNSPNVAKKHYLHTTDEHFANAVKPKSAAPALQRIAAPARFEENPVSDSIGETLTLQRVATVRENTRRVLLGDEGLEPPTSTV